MFLLSNREGMRVVPALVVRRAPNASGELRVDGITTSAPWLRVRADRVSEPHPPSDGLPGVAPGDWVLRAEVTDQAPWGRTRETVRFRTGLADQPDVELVASVERRPLITLSAERVTLAPDGTATVLGSLRAGIDPQSFSVSADGGVRVDTEVSGPRQYTFHLVRDTEANGPASIVFKAGAESYRVPVDATASP
jgi:hypothetical protein